MTTDELERQLRGTLRETLDREQGPHPAWTESPAARRVAGLDRRGRRWPLRVLAVAALIGAVGGAALLAGAPNRPEDDATMQLFDAEDIRSLVPHDGDFDGADYTFSVQRCPGGAS